MTGVGIDEFCSFYPRLYHMAWDDSWETIGQLGLLSTSSLLDVYKVSGDARTAIEAAHRPKPVLLRRKGHPAVTIRDQHPMSEKALERCLRDGVTPEQWFRTLNERVFFWLTRERLGRMMNSPAYVHMPHLVLTLCTRTIAEKHWSSVRLCAMNSGCTVPFAHPRGAGTFLKPAEYPWDERRARGKDRVVEFTVLGGVSSVQDALISKHMHMPD